MTSRKDQLIKIQSEGLELFIKKNKDYGDAFANSGSIGVLVRIGDKISRLQNITKNSINLVSDESCRDTLIDLHNYAAMAIMLLDENNETTKNKEEEIKEDEKSKDYFPSVTIPIQNIWWEESKTDSNISYKVTKYQDGNYNCTCLGFKYRGWCNHLEKYKNYL
tara:strand:+ start:903 stop:1394 length:492 start_codon:yes stop_codon:yes gene_type:complete